MNNFSVNWNSGFRALFVSRVSGWYWLPENGDHIPIFHGSSYSFVRNRTTTFTDSSKLTWYTCFTHFTPSMDNRFIYFGLIRLQRAHSHISTSTWSDSSIRYSYVPKTVRFARGMFFTTRLPRKLSIHVPTIDPPKWAATDPPSYLYIYILQTSVPGVKPRTSVLSPAHERWVGLCCARKCGIRVQCGRFFVARHSEHIGFHR